jgi:hypothetical protein
MCPSCINSRLLSLKINCDNVEILATFPRDSSRTANGSQSAPFCEGSCFSSTRLFTFCGRLARTPASGITARLAGTTIW